MLILCKDNHLNVIISITYAFLYKKNIYFSTKIMLEWKTIRNFATR